jgi:putative peptidoglycan binding protein
MKHIVFLTCIGSLALALTALGAPKGASTHGSARARSAPKAHAISARGGAHVASRSAPMRGGFSKAQSHQRTIASTSRSNRMETAKARSTRITNAKTEAIARNRAAISRERSFARANASRLNRNEAARIRSAQTNARIARNNLALNRQRNLTVARNVAINRAANVRIVNDWRNARFRGSNYAAFYNYNRVWHDSGWWTNNYPWTVYAAALGGWWYWNAGYWYPAWGYDPYAYYPYDGPIYGYGNLTPDRIITNVQVALQGQGYYAGSIDGDLGPQTRGALAAFQADHGLAVTSAVDRPTLQTLGLA